MAKVINAQSVAAAGNVTSSPQRVAGSNTATIAVDTVANAWTINVQVQLDAAGGWFTLLPGGANAGANEDVAFLESSLAGDNAWTVYVGGAINMRIVATNNGAGAEAISAWIQPGPTYR